MLEEVDYEANSFDFITFGAVLEHLYDPAQSIKQVMKWLETKWCYSNRGSFFKMANPVCYSTNFLS